MILVEERLKELFETLPVITVSHSDYKPQFDFGTHEDLLRYLRSKAKEGGKFYPLIWLETPIVKKGKENRIYIDLKLVLATLTKAELSNTNRLEVTFKPTLVPLYNNIYKALRKSGFTRIVDPENNKRTDFYNYGVKKKNGNETENIATDIWDAIKLECELEITNDCKKNINY